MKDIKKVAILFSGGPAPAANAVIGSAVSTFLKHGISVIGIKHGYSNLEKYEGSDARLVAGEHYIEFSDDIVSGIRNDRGIIIGTSRANPGKPIKKREDFTSKEKTQKLDNVYQALKSLNVDALISIGGDDTLKTANYLLEYQKHLPDNSNKIRVIHLPKTIDNDYHGIDFTFGYFSAVDILSKELRNLRADAQASSTYFVVEAMGRKAGWLSYGIAIAGEADLVMSIEDISGDLLIDETTTDTATGKSKIEKRINLDAFLHKLISLIDNRYQQKKKWGVIVLAEGITEMLPSTFTSHLAKDEHGHLALSKSGNLGKTIADLLSKVYEQKTGRPQKVTGVQLGYESRCTAPNAIDVILGSQLGVGAYRALIENKLNGCMVSAEGQFQLKYVPFEKLVNPETLVTEVRFIQTGSDFQQLARYLE